MKKFAKEYLCFKNLCPGTMVLLTNIVVTLGVVVLFNNDSFASNRSLPISAATIPAGAAEHAEPALTKAVPKQTSRITEILSDEKLVSALAAMQKPAEPAEKWHTVRMKVTAYCPCSICCGDQSDGFTANMHKVRPGDVFVAADRRYSFGTELVIPGYNSSMTVEVKDRGGAIKGNRLDVFFYSHDEALQWGVKNLDVKVRG